MIYEAHEIIHVDRFKLTCIYPIIAFEVIVQINQCDAKVNLPMLAIRHVHSVLNLVSKGER